MRRSISGGWPRAVLLLLPLLLWSLLSGCLVEFDPALLDDAGAGCDEPPTCQGDELQACGTTIANCPLGCVVDDGEARCQGFTPKNGLPSPGAGGGAAVAISSAALLESCTGRLDGDPVAGVTFTTVLQQGGPRIGVLRLSSFSVAAEGHLVVSGACALAIVSDRAVRVDGVLDLQGGQNAPYISGPGGFSGAFLGRGAGCAPGLDAAAPEALASGGGGGGGGSGSAGGMGGDAGADTASGGEGAVACEGDELAPLTGGSGGGAGACATRPCSGGYGGGGGGALALISAERVVVSATGGINLGGAGGEGATAGNGGGGGGGSGGSLLVQAPEVQIDGSARIGAGGGGGGGVAAADGSAEQARGESGRLDGQPAAPGDGVVAGGKGASLGEDAGPGAAGAEEIGGGGGGGGLGRVRVDSLTGALDLPDIAARVTQGTITARAR